MERDKKGKVSIITLGCKVNQYESEVLREKFQEAGYEITEQDDYADVYVINTCTVTNLSDRKSRQYIRRARRRNADAIIAVTGCYAQVSPDQIAEMEGVHIVAGTNEKGNFVKYVDDFRQRYLEDKKQNSESQAGRDCLQTERYIQPYEALNTFEETGPIATMDSRTRAFLKIQEGCDRFCSYCIIPYARGQVRSRRLEDIVEEAERLVESGYKELVLTGINAALYGMESGFECNKSGFGIEIVVKALNDIPGDFRIRLSSLEPNVIHWEYAKNLLKYEKLCKHMHLSLQSGSDPVLDRMNRNYRINDYWKLVRTLREFDPEYGISTDIIVGFPGETEEEFNQSLEVVKAADFCKTHVFKYSMRSGTRAAEMKDQIDSMVKNVRSEILIGAGEESSKRFFENNLKKRRLVLFERKDEKSGMYEGYTDNYIKVYAEADDTVISRFFPVEMTELWNDGVKGVIIKESV